MVFKFLARFLRHRLEVKFKMVKIVMSVFMQHTEELRVPADNPCA